MIYLFHTATKPNVSKNCASFFQRTIMTERSLFTAEGQINDSIGKKGRDRKHVHNEVEIQRSGLEVNPHPRSSHVRV